MSKPRRPKYPPQAAKPASTPAESAPSVTEPGLHEAAPNPVETEPAPFEAQAAFQEATPEPVAQIAESLPAQVERIAAAAASVPASAVAATSPRLLGAESFGTTVMNYFIGEGEAFAAHLRALASARSMADFVRLQIGEFQRAADSTLMCWGMLTMSASRSVTAR